MPKTNKGKSEINSSIGLDAPRPTDAPNTKFDHPPVQLSKHNYPRFMLGLYAWVGAIPKGGADLRALIQHGLNPTDPSVEEAKKVYHELATRKMEIKTRYDRIMLSYNSLKATISTLEHRESHSRYPSRDRQRQCRGSAEIAISCRIFNPS
jgi:hypothetical protein